MLGLKTVLIGFLFALTATNVFMAFYSLASKKTGLAQAFSFVCLSISFYSFGYAMELNSITLDRLLFWNAVKYIGLPFIPTFWVILTLQYTDKGHYLRPSTKLGLFVIPVLTIILRYTNQWHYLFYTTVEVNYDMLFPILSVGKGPWYLVQSIYMACCVLYSSYAYLLLYRRSSGKIKKQCEVMLWGSMIPWLSHFPNLFSFNPYGIDLGPFLGSITAIMFLAGLFKYDFLDLKPLARDNLFHCTNDGIIVLDTNYCIIDFNDAAANIFQSLNEDSVSKNIQSVIFQKGLLDSLLSGKEISYKTIRNHSKKHFSLRTSDIIDKKGFVVGFLITITDITNYVVAMERLNEMASVDELTKTYNRRYFFEQSSMELEKARQRKDGLSFIILDIDYFKTINDNYGHQAGDLILQHVSEICQRSIRSGDILGRYGGEEFIILLPNTTIKDSMVIANRVKKNIEEAEIPFEGKLIRFTASLGVTGIDVVTDQSLSLFLKKADDALYQAKSAGRNRVLAAPFYPGET